MKGFNVVERRKIEHLIISLRLYDEERRYANTLFDDIYLIHNAIPEMNLEDVDTSTKFLGHNLKAPIIVEGMTGGFELAKKLNGVIASAIEELGLGMGVGSQRAALENPELIETFKVAREKAPTSFLIGNIGATQVALSYSLDDLIKVIEMINADALAIHFNTLQECIQFEGEPKFRGITEKLREFCKCLDRPIIAKETGCGFSKEDARKLISIGVKALDVSGVGGTSFALIEGLRAKIYGNTLKHEISKTFAKWGIPTALSILEVRSVSRDIPLIASGGIRTGLEVAKAIALGADVVGIGLPVLKHAIQGGVEGVISYLNKVILEFRIAMLLVGASNVDELKKKPVVLSQRIVNWLNQRGITFRTLN